MLYLIQGVFATAIIGLASWLFTIEPRLQVQRTEMANIKDSINNNLSDIKDRLVSIEEWLRNGRK